jgi:dihydrofolate synthase/folylpolyglutamate synthase
MAASPTIRDHQAAVAYLFGRIDYERTARLPYRSRGLKLDRMRRLVELLHHPQDRYPIVHVAGTKGKGSTATMIASILTAAGRRTGLYTSPHLECIEERMAIDGQQCSGAELVELIARIQPAVETLDAAAGTAGGPTFFEIMTAAAMLYFADHEVDAAVLEVGLGGRLDSTNVCQPAAAVITTISFDHTRQLGNTLAAIATEKAGIVKPGVPVISGVIEPEPRAVIERIAAERGCRLYARERDFTFCYHAPEEVGRAAPFAAQVPGRHGEFDYWEPASGAESGLQRLALGMPGRHQAANAAVALATIGRLRDCGWRVAEADIRRGLAEAWCPARDEIVSWRPAVVIDAAHNVASIRALAEVIDELFQDRPRRMLVFAASQDKDAAGMFRALLPRFDRVLLTRFLNNPRAVAPSALEETVRRVVQESGGRPCEISVHPEPAAAWAAAWAAASPDDLICVAGSFFLAGELRGAIREEVAPAQVA